MLRAHLVCSAGLTVALTVALAAAPASAQSPLDAALGLYAAASYDAALAALDSARQAQPSGEDLVTIERHRMLCLVALGRTAAAQDVVASLLDARPDFVLTAGDASPRVRAVFEAARARVLPDLVRRRYAEAKAAFDAGDFSAAHGEFARVVALLGEPAATAHDAAAADLKVLANGFLALSASSLERAHANRNPETVPPVRRAVQGSKPAEPAIEPPPLFASASPVTSWAMRPVALPQPPPPTFEPEAAPAAAAEPARAPAPAPAPVSAPAPEPVDAPAAAPGAVAAAPAPVESPRFTPMDIFTYDWRDSAVVPPVPVAQSLSGWWGSMREPVAGTQLGAVEVVVDETGAVTDARIYLSVNRFYDNVLLQSVKHWRYRPATKDGRPVKYRRVTGVVSGR